MNNPEKNLTIDYQTSEKVKINYELGNFLTRIGAFIIDSVFQVLALIVLYIAAIIVFGGTSILYGIRENSGDNIPLIPLIIEVVVIVIMLILILLYHVIFEIILKGRTPGKILLHIHVIQENGQILTAVPAILRNLFRLVDLLPVFYIAGLICMLVHKKNKRIGDLVAGTIVVYAPKIQLPEIKPPDISDSLFNPIKNNLQNIFSQLDKQLIYDYIKNRFEMNYTTLKSVEKKLIQYIEKKTLIPKPVKMKNNQYITMLYNMLS